MTPNKTPIRTYLSAEDHSRLEQEAAGRGVSVSQCARDCLREYFALRTEMATALEAPGRPGEPHTGLIHALLARTEERLAASLDAQAEHVGRLREDLRALQAMLDRFALLYLVHTPDVPPAQREAALASGQRRHASWRQAVARLAPSAGAPDGGAAAEPVEVGA